MRMTSRKKEILNFFEPEHREWVTPEIGAPPFDVSGIAYLLTGMELFENQLDIDISMILLILFFIGVLSSPLIAPLL